MGCRGPSRDRRAVQGTAARLERDRPGRTAKSYSRSTPAISLERRLKIHGTSKLAARAGLQKPSGTHQPDPWDARKLQPVRHHETVAVDGEG